MAMTISQLAGSAGIGVETVRFYQRRGLLEDPRPRATGASGTRHYGAEDLRRLRFIRSAQAAGFTLGEVARLITLDAANDRPQAQAMAAQRIAALDREIAERTAARTALAALARECAHGGEGPCPILDAFETGT